MWDMDLPLLAPCALQGKDSPKDRQSGMLTLCQERKGWATRGLCRVRGGPPAVNPPLYNLPPKNPPRWYRMALEQTVTRA
jgi:hypothetical protein